MQVSKVHMSQRKFRIGELAKHLKIKKFVIRFWEKEFELKFDRSQGGQRFYSEQDLNTFSLIKQLLYEKKFTIPGAKKELEFFLAGKQIPKINLDNIEPAKQEKLHAINKAEVNQISKDFLQKISNLKEKLLKFKEILN